MKVLMCGFLGPPVYVTSLPEAVRIVESGSTRQPQLILLSGGWGDAGIISDGRLQLLSGRSAIPTGLPEGSAAAAALGWRHLVALSNSGRSYTCDLSNSHSEPPADSCAESSQQAEDPSVTWNLVKLSEAVTAVAAGELHSALLTADGSVWTWGSNTDCQLGWALDAASAIHESCPKAVAGPAAVHHGMSDAGGQPVNLGGHQQAVTAMACGARHTCAVSHMGQLFCWGWSLHGQCGQGRAVVSVPQPQAVPALGGLKVRGVAAGLAHTVACTDSGDVYSWGWNADGQLGLGDDQSRGEPELVADPLLEDSHIEQVSCGARHTLVKGHHGNCFSWGWNKYGQLGLGDTDNRLVPHVMHGHGTVLDSACGWWHTGLVVMNDKQYSQVVLSQ